MLKKMNTLAMAAADQVHEFISRTPALTASEHAEFVGTEVESSLPGGNTGEQNFAGDGFAGSGLESKTASRGRRSGGTDWGQISQGIQAGLSALSTGAQLIGGIAGAVGGNDRGARDFSRVMQGIGLGAGQVGNMVGALRNNRFPSVQNFSRGQQVPQRAQPVTRQSVTSRTQGQASRQPPPARSQPPQQTRPPQRTQPPQRTHPRGPTTPASSRQRPAGQRNATAMLGMMLSDPRIAQALRQAAMSGGRNQVGVNLRIPRSGNVSVPPAALLNTLMQLSRASMEELNFIETEQTDIPEYLLGDDGEFLVDPSSAEERGALVLHLFRTDGEARRAKQYDETQSTIFATENFQGACEGCGSDYSACECI